MRRIPRLPRSWSGAVLVCLLMTAFISPAGAQEMSPADRERGVQSLRAFATCLRAQERRMAELTRLIEAAERQRRASDAAVQRDAERTIEALLVRGQEAQRAARACLESEEIGAPGPRVEERGPPPDPSADRIAQAGGSLSRIEGEGRLHRHVSVVRAQQVDGQGRVDREAIRQAVRGIAPRLAACYEGYLDRGTGDGRELDLVFTLSPGGAVGPVLIERSAFRDGVFEACLRRAAQAIRPSRPPSGGAATVAYTLRFSAR